MEAVIAEYKALDEESAKLYGLELEAYVNTYLEYTMEEYEEAVREYAEEVVGSQLIVAAIAKAEGLDAEQVTDTEIERCAADNGYDSADSYKEDYSEEEIRQEVLYNRVTDFVVAAAEEV